MIITHCIHILNYHYNYVQVLCQLRIKTIKMCLLSPPNLLIHPKKICGVSTDRQTLRLASGSEALLLVIESGHAAFHTSLLTRETFDRVSAVSNVLYFLSRV